MKLIVSALFEEIEDIFNNFKLDKINSRFELYKTTINDQEVIVGCCGVGKSNAAMFTQFCIDHYNIDEVISIGAAGSTNTTLNIGDIVVGESFIYGDVDVRIFDYKFGQVPQRPAYYEGTKLDVINYKELDFKVINGTIVTVDKFVHTYDEKFDLIENKDAIEMESTSIAQTCNFNDIKITCFRCISDNSFYENNSAQSYSETKKIISINLFKILKLYLKG